MVLELGGNAAVVVDADTDLDDAVNRIIFGAFYQSGQSCIGVQRIIVHQDIYDDFKFRFIEATNALVSGDPLDENTFIGPMIAESEAKRLQEWIHEAVELGGQVLTGGTRDGAMLDATVLENVPDDALINRKEAFGPVAVLSEFCRFR